MEKFTKLKKVGFLNATNTNSIMSNFLIRAIVLFSSLCITFLLFFVADQFFFLEDIQTCVVLVVICFSITIIISMLPQKYFSEQVITPLYLFGTYLLFFLVDDSITLGNLSLNTYLISVLFVFMFLISRSYINVTISVILLFYQLINIQLLTLGPFAFYYILVLLYCAFLWSNVFTVRILMLMKGNLEKFNGLLLGLICSLFYLLFQSSFVIPFLSFYHDFFSLNIIIALLLTVITLPIFYNSILKNKLFYNSKYKLFFVTILCLLICSTNLFILLSLLVTVTCFAYQFRTGVIVGLAGIVGSIIYTFISNDIIPVIKIVTLIFIGIILLTLFYQLKLKNRAIK